MASDASAELKKSDAAAVLKKNVSTWSKQEVGEWLQNVGHGEFKEKFCENEIDGKALVKLTQDDLKELGIQALGTRKMVIELIASLPEETTKNEENEKKKRKTETDELIKKFLKESGSEFDMTDYGGDDVDFVIRALLQKSSGKDLEKIILYGTHITDDAVKELAHNCPKLSMLGLSRCTSITDAAVIEIACKCTNLEIFYIPPGATDVGKKELTSRGFQEKFGGTTFIRYKHTNSPSIAGVLGSLFS